MPEAERAAVPSRSVGSIDELKELVGQDLGVGGWVEITQQMVNDFGEISGQSGWVHNDPVRAANSSFGGTIAQGYLILSLEAVLGREWEGIKMDLHQKVTLNYGLNRVRFVTPVRVGARIRLGSKLLEVSDVGEGAYQIVTALTVEVEGQEKPAMVAERIRRLYL